MMLLCMRVHTEQLGTVMSTGSISADANGSAFDMRDNDALRVKVVCTGDLVGPVYLQGSDASDGTFVTLTDGNGDAIAVATLAGAGATFIQSISDVNVEFCRLFFDRTSGTGTIVATAAVK